MADNENESTTMAELREHQTRLVTAIATETDLSKLEQLQQELESTARRLERDRAQKQEAAES